MPSRKRNRTTANLGSYARKKVLHIFINFTNTKVPLSIYRKSTKDPQHHPSQPQSIHLFPMTVILNLKTLSTHQKLFTLNSPIVKAMMVWLRTYWTLTCLRRIMSQPLKRSWKHMLSSLKPNPGLILILFALDLRDALSGIWMVIGRV
jgi:hypothetical protein